MSTITNQHRHPRTHDCHHVCVHTQPIHLPRHELFFCGSERQALRFPGVWTHPCAGPAFEPNGTDGLVVCLVVCLVGCVCVCSRSTFPLFDLSRYLSDDLESCGGVFLSSWILALKMDSKLAPLILPEVQLIFGRSSDQQVPSSCFDLKFDLVCSSLAIGGSAPRGHRDCSCPIEYESANSHAQFNTSTE